MKTGLGKPKAEKKNFYTIYCLYIKYAIANRNIQIKIEYSNNRNKQGQNLFAVYAESNKARVLCLKMKILFSNAIF